MEMNVCFGHINRLLKTYFGYIYSSVSCDPTEVDEVGQKAGDDIGLNI